jgi:hypothetical protein
MSRLPVPGGDDGTWGGILNDFLSQSLNSDGTLKTAAVTASGAALDSAVVHNTGSEAIAGVKAFSSSPTVPTPTTSTAAANKAYVDSTAGAGAANATTSSPGLVQLAGDLGGTGTVATAPVITDGAITNSKIANGAVSTNKLAAGSVTTNEIADGTITNTDISGAAAIARTKLDSSTQTSLGKADTAVQSVNSKSGTSITLVPSDIGAIPISAFMAKGDVLAGTGVGAWSNLAVGTDGQVLSADSTQTTGVKWATPVSGSQALAATAVQSSPYSAAAGDFVPVDASGGSVTITLPTAPTDKTRIGIKLIAVSGSNTVTINRGGSSDVFNKAGGSTSLTLSALFQGVLLQYASSTGIWYVQADDLPLNVASGAAKLGTDGTVGGPSGSPLSSSVVSVVLTSASDATIAATSYSPNTTVLQVRSLTASPMTVLAEWQVP